MDARRFGIGIAAGLLLGLGIIAASGVGSASAGLFGTFAAVNAGVTSGVTSASTTSGITQSSTPSYTVGMGNGTSAFTSTQTMPSASTSTGTSTSSYPPSAGGPAADNNVNFIAAAASHLPSSSFGSISQQPVSTNTILLVPLIIAFLLGGLLYRASRRGKNEQGDSDPPEP